MGLLFFVEHSLKSDNLLLHLAVDLKISRYDHFHFVYVLVDVAAFVAVPILER
jgi:hypothetical protein